ncbi:phosphate acyltransferase PlsX [Mycoplasmatota bacterium zrk1]
MIRIAVDAMGGDYAPKITVIGAMEAIKKFSDIEITLFGNKYEIHKYLTNSNRISVVHTLEAIKMDEKEAIKKMRRDKKTSMAMAMYSVKEEKNDAFVTAGPTGPFVAGAHLIIRRINGMKRTALTPMFPTVNGHCLFMDVGANIEIKPEHLLQYAHSGSIYAREVLEIDNPKVALINNGEEKGKGRVIEQEAYKLLEQDPKINFIGNLESKYLFDTDADVVVTDGFTGNAIMKASEGVLKAFSTLLKNEIKKSTKAKLGAVIMKKNLKNVVKKFDASEVGGAILLGVKAPVIKAHGASDAYSFTSAIRQARSIVKKEVVRKISNVLESE